MWIDKSPDYGPLTMGSPVLSTCKECFYLGIDSYWMWNDKSPDNGPTTVRSPALSTSKEWFSLSCIDLV